MCDIANACRAFPAFDLLAAAEFLPIVEALDADVAELVVAWSEAVKAWYQRTTPFSGIGPTSLHAIA
jgi:hypothetical protein